MSLIKFPSLVLSTLSDQLLNATDLIIKPIINTCACNDIQRKSERQKVSIINKPTDEENRAVACMLFTYNYTK